MTDPKDVWAAIEDYADAWAELARDRSVDNTRARRDRLKELFDLLVGENEELAQLWRGEQKQTIECSRLLHDAEVALRAARAENVALREDREKLERQVAEVRSTAEQMRRAIERLTNVDG